MRQQFIDYLVTTKGYSKNTARAYDTDIKHFANFIHQYDNTLRWSTITLDVVDAYKMYMYKLGLSAATQNRRLASLSGIYRYMQRQGMLSDNPVKYESRSKLEQSLPNIIPTNDIITAAAHAEPETALAIMLLFTTGIRLQELIDMRTADVSDEENSIKIHGKGNKERMVYTTDAVMAHLRKHIEMRAVFVFHQYDQRTWRYKIYNALRLYSRAPQCSPHAIRHTFATLMTSRGIPTATLAQLLGHENVKTTQRYLAMNNEQIAAQYAQYMSN